MAVQRHHHHLADREGDPHSPSEDFFWGYAGWFLAKQDALRAKPLLERYAKDMLRDPFNVWLERRENWVRVTVAS